MNIIYPQNALTLKNLSKSNQWLYRSIAVNMLKYNHDSSNVLRLLDGLGSWLYDDFLDVNYQFNLGLNNVDFTTIDRINKFTIASVPNSSYNANSDVLTFTDIIYGYSKYTNNIYQLYNSNILSDMVRYSFPCDVFLEKTPVQYSDVQKIELSPNVRNNINMYVCGSQITVSIETPSFQLAYGVDPVELAFGTAAMFEIRGYNRYNEEVSEYLVLEDIWSLVSENVYSKVESIMCIGLMGNITVTVSPYIKHNAVLWDDLYIEREEFDEYLTWCWINTDNNRLSFSTVINDNTYLPKYDLLDQYRFNIGSTEMISDYILDQANQVITLVAQDIVTKENFLYEFPLIIPLNRDLYGTLKNTQEQYIKVSYLRDALNQQFKLYIYPSEKQNNIDSLTITAKKIVDMSKYVGIWTSGVMYNAGDMVLHIGNFKGDFQQGATYYRNEIVLKNGSYFKCIVDNYNPDINLEINFNSWTPYQITDSYYICSKETSSSIFRTTGLNVEWIPQVTTLVENMLLDLITYNIETNLITLNFSDLFPFNEQTIVTITTSGNGAGSCEIVLQDPILKYTVRKPLLDLFTYTTPVVPSNALGPIPTNNNLLLVDNLESYDVGTLPEITPVQPILFSLTSSNCDYINGYKLIDVYNNFFIDGNGGNLVVSDTITGIVGDLNAPPATTTTTSAPTSTTHPPATTTTQGPSSSQWYNLIDINLWGADGSGNVINKFGTIYSDDVNNTTQIISSANLVPNINALTLVADGSYTNGDQIFESPAFWGKANPAKVRMPSPDVTTPNDYTSWEPSKAWQPTKIRATFDTNASVTFSLRDVSHNWVLTRIPIVSGQEIEIPSTVGLTGDSSIWKITLETTGDTSNVFTPLTLEAYGDDPAQYYRVGDFGVTSTTQAPITTTSTTTSTTTQAPATTTSAPPPTPGEWVDVTDPNYWIFFKEYGFPVALDGGTWDGNVIDSWVTTDWGGYSEVYIHVNPATWPQFRASKMRITYSNINSDEITVNIVALTDYTNVIVGKDTGDADPTYSNLQEIDLSTLTDTFSVEIWRDSANQFTINKIEVLFSSEVQVPIPYATLLIKGAANSKFDYLTYDSAILVKLNDPTSIVLHPADDYIIDSVLINGVESKSFFSPNEYGEISYDISSLTEDLIVIPSYVIDSKVVTVTGDGGFPVTMLGRTGVTVSSAGTGWNTSDITFTANPLNGWAMAGVNIVGTYGSMTSIASSVYGGFDVTIHNIQSDLAVTVSYHPQG